MNITLYKKHNFGGTTPRFTADIYNTFWITPIKDASGIFTNWNTYEGASAEELESMKYDLSQVTISIPSEEIINAYGMFAQNKLIRKVEIDFPNATNITWMFQNSSIEEIESDFSSVNENCGGVFAQCKNLKIVRCNFQNLKDRKMGAGEGITDGTNGKDDYSFTFYNRGNLETVECNFSSLINANNLFGMCPKLKNFDCELDSLETAEGMCPDAKLTAESVRNIADKIKTHTDGETHRIDLGIEAKNEEQLLFENFYQHFNKLSDKNWTINAYYDSTENRNIELDTYKNEIVTNETNRIEKNDPLEAYLMQFTEGTTKTNDAKKGFVMYSEEETRYFNSIIIKTGQIGNGTYRVRIDVYDSTTTLKAQSDYVSLNASNTEFKFNFSKPFEMLGTKFNHLDDGSIELANVDEDNFYQFVFKAADGNLVEFKQTTIQKPKNGGYGMIFNQGNSKYKTRWSFKDDDHPSGEDSGNEEQFDYTAWCKFELTPVENSTPYQDGESLVVTNAVNDYYSHKKTIGLKLSLKDELVQISSIDYKLKQMGDPAQIFDNNEDFPIILEQEIIDNTSINLIIGKKDDLTGDFRLIITVTDTKNQKHYKTISFKAE